MRNQNLIITFFTLSRCILDSGWMTLENPKLNQVLRNLTLILPTTRGLLTKLVPVESNFKRDPFAIYLKTNRGFLRINTSYATLGLVFFGTCTGTRFGGGILSFFLSCKSNYPFHHQYSEKLKIHIRSELARNCQKTESPKFETNVNEPPYCRIKSRFLSNIALKNTL
uniref:Uncharacterized protein n=1 Tax=Glossina pallidipes TaxID=7398 RepID=A0A1B0A0E2_GLOPL